MATKGADKEIREMCGFLRRFRMEKGLTHREMASKLEVSVTDYSNLELKGSGLRHYHLVKSVLKNVPGFRDAF